MQVCSDLGHAKCVHCFKESLAGMAHPNNAPPLAATMQVRTT